MTRELRRFTQDFKAETVKKYLEMRADGKSIPEIEKEIGIGNSSIYKWVQRAREQSRQITTATMMPEPRLTTQAPVKTKSGRFPNEVRQRALQLLATGLKTHEVSKQLKVKPATIAYWNATQGRKLVQAPVDQSRERPPTKPGNGIGSGGAITDALIYLRHAEREIMDMVRDGKISRPDQAHLLTLLALGALQKAIAE